MHMDEYAVIMYVFFWVVRIRGCASRDQRTHHGGTRRASGVFVRRADPHRRT